MAEILTDLSAPALVAAIEANVIEQFPLVSARLPHIEIHDEPDILWVITDAPHPYLSCVLRAQLGTDHIDARINATLTHLRSRRLGFEEYCRFGIYVWEGVHVSKIGRACERRIR